MLGTKLLLTLALEEHHFKTARALLVEYAKVYGVAKADVGSYVDELQNLRRDYAPPDGRLYLIFTGGQPAGCIAMRRFDEKRCEMRRLFVRPQYHGQNIGVVLVRQLLNDAREVGYKAMLLSSLESMKTAHALFRRVGFKKLNSPVPGALILPSGREDMVYFEKQL